MKTRFAWLAVAGAIMFPQVSQADPVADFYAGKTVKIVIGASMGGSYGLYAQYMARHVSRHLAGAPTVVVQSMPGSGGNKAMNYVYTAAPQDGSVVSIVQISVVQESLFNPKVRFDAKGYHYIGRFTDTNIVTTCRKVSGIKSWKDAKTKSYTVGTIGRRNYTYIGVATMNLMAGAKFKVISGYRGTTQSYLANDRGEVDCAATSWNTLLVKHANDLKDGNYIPVIQMTATRQPDLPNIPTISEFGKTNAEKAFLKIIAAGGSIGRTMAGPPGMPKNLVAAWNAAFTATVNDPAFKEDVAKRHSMLHPKTGAEMTKIVHDVMNLPKADVQGAFKIYTKLLKAKY